MLIAVATSAAAQQAPGIDDGQSAAGLHDMSAVDECQAFFGLRALPGSNPARRRASPAW